MDSINAKVMAKLYPEFHVDKSLTWQERKSKETRYALLNATINCLKKNGYSGTSIRTISKEAGISHAAVSHHYSSKLSLISAVIDYAFYKRIVTYHIEYEKLSEADRVDLLLGVELFFYSLQTDEYLACLELLIACRTDSELKEIFVPKAKRFDKLWRRELKRLYPEWGKDETIYSLSTDFGFSLFEGALLNQDVWADQKRMQRLMKLYMLLGRMIRDGEVDISGI
ncbi:MAG: TetR/AcrR family transcriptional regulator [bacterium]